MKLIEDIARNISYGIQIDLVLHHFSKAFDVANHLKLLTKL